MGILTVLPEGDEGDGQELLLLALVAVAHDLRRVLVGFVLVEVAVEADVEIGAEPPPMSSR